MKITQITANLITLDMETTLEFYTGLLDFKVDIHMPEQRPYDWVQLSHGPVEIMFQTASSIKEDLGITGDGTTGGTLLFHTDVTDIEGWFDHLSGKAKIAFPMRTTFYGTKEFGFHDPNGYLIVFAERV